MTDTDKAPASTRLDALRLRELLAYDSSSGVFVRRVDRGRQYKAGSVAGSINASGYVAIGIAGDTYKAHRLAWLYCHGHWPSAEIDHINGDKTDNRMSNLRLSTRSENTTNRFRARRDNRLGILGVTQIGGRFIARFRDAYLGIFRTPEEAHAAYQAARNGVRA